LIAESDGYLEKLREIATAAQLKGPRPWRSPKLTRLCSFKVTLSPKTVFSFQVGL
jgi:hypothetical protein